MANCNDTETVSNVNYVGQVYRYRFIIIIVALLIALQYFFGASVYNVLVFDYNMSDMYNWRGNKEYKKGARDDRVPTDPPNASSLTTSDNDLDNIGAVPIPGDDLARNNFMDTSHSTPSTQSIRTDSDQLTEDPEETPSDLILSEDDSMDTTPAQPMTQLRQPQSLHMCPVLTPNLVGPIEVNYESPSYEELENKYSHLESGGHGKPKQCQSRHKVVIIIPYRDRDSHLRTFLNHMHSFLGKQQLDYAIFVVELVANQTFNRAKLMNVGFVEAMKQYDWQCAIFHDVDLLPEDDRNIYSCPEQPRHMSVGVDKFSYKLPYDGIFGGVSALTVEQFGQLNGYSNDYWGWGGEDDDMATRVKMHYSITRYPAEIARYKMMKHVGEKLNAVNECRYNLMYKTMSRWQRDGLNSVNYKLLQLEKTQLLTRVTVDLLEDESRKRLAEEKICKS